MDEEVPQGSAGFMRRERERLAAEKERLAAEKARTVLEARLADLFPFDPSTGFSSREQARRATQRAIEGLPTSLRNRISYAMNEHVGYPARDSLKQAGDLCEWLEKMDLKTNNMSWVQPYLLAMGGALQLLDMVTFKNPEVLRVIPVEARQRILMSMDLLSGCLSYAVSTVQGTYNETIRRNFLLTHGLKFVSTERARKRYRHRPHRRTSRRSARRPPC